jgi:hypothetical protein
MSSSGPAVGVLGVDLGLSPGIQVGRRGPRGCRRSGGQSDAKSEWMLDTRQLGELPSVGVLLPPDDLVAFEIPYMDNLRVERFPR